MLGGRFVPPEQIAIELARLRAAAGVVAVLGNQLRVRCGHRQTSSPGEVNRRRLSWQTKTALHEASEGLPREGVLRVALPRPRRINCNWLVTLTKAHVLERAGARSSAKLDQLEVALRRAGLE